MDEAVVAARDVDEIVSDEGRGHRDHRGALDAPQLSAGIRIVAAKVLRPVRDELGAVAAFVDRRRRPRRQPFTFCTPHLLARGSLERGEERPFLLIALHNDKVLVEDRRAGVAPFVIGHVEGAMVERADVLFPEQVAVQVERVEALGAEESDHTLAVGGGRGGGIAVVWMTSDSRLHLGSDFLPEDLSAPFVETEDLELVLREIRAAIDLAGERDTGKRTADRSRPRW